MIRVPRRTMSFVTHISLDMPLKALGSLCKVLSMMQFRTSCISGSLVKADRISSVLIALGDMCWVRRLTYRSAQLLRFGGCCRGVNRESKSAKFWEPHYTTFKSYSCNRSCHLSMRAEGGLLAFG